MVAAPRYSAAAALDGWGLAPHGFQVWSLRHHPTLDDKARVLVCRVTRLVRSTGAAQVVLGVPLVDDVRTKLLRAQIAGRLRSLGIAVAVREIRETRRLILGRYRGPGQNALPAAIIRGFFPGLAPYMKERRRDGYYWWNSFEAVALAIAGLVETAPRSAFALARPEAFSSAAFREALAAADLRKYPCDPIIAPAKADAPHAAPARARRLPCLPLSPQVGTARAPAAPRPAGSLNRRLWEGATHRASSRTPNKVRT